MNLKTIILLYLTNYIATVNSADDEIAEMETDRPDSSVYSLADVITCSDTLEQVKINDCRKLVKLADDSFPHIVKNILIKNSWPTKLVDDLVKNYNKNNWPSGISCEHLSKEEKERRIKDYTCRRVPGFLGGNREEAVIVMATDNHPYMPADSIDHPGFLMVLNPGALNYVNLENFIGMEHGLDPVEVNRWDLLLTVPDGSLPARVEELLIENNWTRREVDAVVGKYDQSSWPSDLSGTRFHSVQTTFLMKKYKCRLVPGVLSDNQEQAVIVFASDNTQMPADMIAEPAFLMIFQSGALSKNSCFENLLRSTIGCPIL